jgi:hypothetical protein
MAVEQPERSEREIVDSGVHISDTERSGMSAWQVLMAAALIVAILCVFFYGLTNQRVEVAGSTPPPATQTNVPATEQTKTTVGTTGQAPNPENPRRGAQQELPHKANPTPPQQNGGQNARPPASMPGEPGETSR